MLLFGLWGVFFAFFKKLTWKLIKRHWTCRLNSTVEKTGKSRNQDSDLLGNHNEVNYDWLWNSNSSNNELLHSVLHVLAYSVKRWKSLVKNVLSVNWWPNRYALNYKDWTIWEKPILHLLTSDRWEKEWMKYFNFFFQWYFYYQSCIIRINSTLIIDTGLHYDPNFYQISHIR